MGSIVPAMATTAPVVLSAGYTIYGGETVTINEPPNYPPFVGSGPVSVEIFTGADSNVGNVQGTENGNSVTFTLPVNLSVPSGTPMYFLIEDPQFLYFTPNYTWGGSAPVGDMPEVPVAGALPVIGLAGAAVILYTRRRSRAL